MSVLSVTQIFGGEKFNRDVKRREKVWVYRVITDSADMEPEEVETASDGATSIPAVDTAIGRYRVKSADADRDEENPFVFRVSVTLSDAQDEPQGGGNSAGNKFNQDITITTEPYEEPVYFDIDGQAITNSAGQPFSNQPTRTYYDERIVISFDTQAVDTANIDKCKGNLNSNTINVDIKGYKRKIAKGTLKMVDSRQSARPSDADFIWHCEYSFLCRKDGWKRKILSVGRMQLIGAVEGEPGHTRVNCTTEHGDHVTEDVPLDLYGKQVPPEHLFEAAKVGNDDTSPDPAVYGHPCYFEYAIEPSANFAGLLTGTNRP
jgi:hypothetical protein